MINNDKVDASRVFEGGASRNSDDGKLDYDGFLSHEVLESYALYMQQMRYLEDGSKRDSDNWKLGIPKDQYMKSIWRHFMDVWQSQHNKPQESGVSYDKVRQLNALLFNVMGLLYEELKDKKL